MAGKKNGDNGKKIKFEFSRLGFAFVVLVFLCIVVWSFIFGVWVGIKLGSKPEQELTLKEAPLTEYSPEQEVTNVTSSMVSKEELFNATNETEKKVVKKKIQPEAAVKLLKPKSAPSKAAIISEKKVHKEIKKEKVSKKERVSKKKVVKHVKKTKRELYYAVQVGAFSKYEFAKSMMKKLKEKGFKTELLVINKGKKKIYKVVVGKFHRRKEAEVEAVKVKEVLGIKGAFVIEVRKGW